MPTSIISFTFRVLISLFFLVGSIQSSFAEQENSKLDSITVHFFQTNNNGQGDTTAIYGLQSTSTSSNNTSPTNALMGIYGNVNMNGHVFFVNTKSPQTYACVTAITDGKHGANLLFYGEKWENDTGAHMKGNGFVSFSGNTKQSIQNTKDNKKRTSFPGIQINNPKDVYLQGEKAIRIDNQAIFYAGKLHVSGDTLFFSKTITQAECDDKNSYVLLPESNTISALVAKDTTAKSNNNHFHFRFPIGTEKSYSPITVVLNGSGSSGSSSGTHSIFTRVYNDYPLNNDTPMMPSQKRYDKSARSFWAVNTNIPKSTSGGGYGNYINPDSVYLGLEKSYSQTVVGSNFHVGRAFVSQFISPKERTAATSASVSLLEGSNWDRPTLDDGSLFPEVKTISKSGKRTTLFTYRRQGQNTKLMLKADQKTTPTATAKDSFSYYTIANYDKHPLTSRFEYSTINYEDEKCMLIANWGFTDKFSGQAYYIQITSDTLNLPKESTMNLRVNENFVQSIGDTAFTYALSLNQLLKEAINPNLTLFARMIEKDFGGDTYSYASAPFHLSCSAKEGSEKTPLVSVVGSIGAGAQMIVQYEATYSEDVQFSIWNILGQKEFDLGRRTLNTGLNNIIFNLPISITRNQRYILLITGGILNEEVKTFSTSFTVK